MRRLMMALQCFVNSFAVELLLINIVLEMWSHNESSDSFRIWNVVLSFGYRRLGCSTILHARPSWL